MHLACRRSQGREEGYHSSVVEASARYNCVVEASAGYDCLMCVAVHDKPSVMAQLSRYLNDRQTSVT